MVRKIVFVLLAVGLFGALAATDGIFVSKAHGAQWYPFYGYHRPSYLDSPRVVSSQPVVSRQCTGAKWYPFYGYYRPSYLDR